MRRDSIAQAALRLLNVDPSAPMARIAASAGVSRATLHRHFATRDDLIIHLGRMSIESWRDALDAAAIDEATESGDVDRIRTAVDDLFGHLLRDAEEYGFTWLEYSLLSDEEVVAGSEVLRAREHAFYAAAQRTGVLRADLPVAWIGHTIFGALVGLREAIRCGDIPVRDAARLLRQTVLHGITASEAVSLPSSSVPAAPRCSWSNRVSGSTAIGRVPARQTTWPTPVCGRSSASPSDAPPLASHDLR